MKKLFTDNISLIAIFVVLVVFFVPQLARGRIPIPSDAIVGLYHPWRDIQVDGYNQEKYPVKNSLITDPVLQTYPWRKIAIDNIKNFEMPLWNPYSFSGQPLAANIQSSVFQPLNFLFFILPFKIAWAAQIYLSAIFAAVFTYFFLRSINLSKGASFFGAIIVPFSSFFTSWMTWGTINIAASFLPLILFSVNKLSNKLTPRYFLTLTGAVAFVLLSGHLQTASYIIVATVLYIFFLSATSKSVKILFVCFAGLLLGMMIASVQILPTLEFASYSNRANDQVYFPEKKDWFLPPQHLIQLIAPDYFGNPTKGNYWGVWNYGEFTQYIGIVPLIFALYALTKMNSKTVFFASLASFSILLALKNPISALPYNLHLPLVSSSQPSRILYLFTFSLAMLAAIGFDTYQKNTNKNKFKFTVLMIAAVYISLIVVTQIAKGSFPAIGEINTQMVALRNMVIPGMVIGATIILAFFKITVKYNRITISSLVLLAVVELLYFSNKFTPFSTFNSIFPKTQTTDFLQTQQKPFRVLSTDRRIANPNLLSAYNIESVSGYDPLYLKKYATFVTAWQSNKTNNSNTSFNRFVTPDNYKSQLANLMNVDYVLTFDDIVTPGFEKVLDEGSTKLYKNNNALNRVFFVNQIIKKESEQDVLDSLANQTDFTKIAYSSSFKFEGGDLGAKAGITKYSDQSIVINTTTSDPTPLIISNINYPGWKGYVDDSEVKIENVNYLMQSIVVPAGEHIVRLTFKPDVFRLSLYMTLTGLLLSLVASAYIWKKSQ